MFASADRTTWFAMYAPIMIIATLPARLATADRSIGNPRPACQICKDSAIASEPPQTMTINVTGPSSARANANARFMPRVSARERATRSNTFTNTCTSTATTAVTPTMVSGSM